MSSKDKKDLGVRIGSPDQKLWEDVKKEALVLIEQSEKNLKIQKAILKLADSKIAEEIKNFK